MWIKILSFPCKSCQGVIGVAREFLCGCYVAPTFVEEWHLPVQKFIGSWGDGKVLLCGWRHYVIATFYKDISGSSPCKSCGWIPGCCGKILVVGWLCKSFQGVVLSFHGHVYVVSWVFWSLLSLDISYLLCCKSNCFFFFFFFCWFYHLPSSYMRNSKHDSNNSQTLPPSNYFLRMCQQQDVSHLESSLFSATPVISCVVPQGYCLYNTLPKVC